MDTKTLTETFLLHQHHLRSFLYRLLIDKQDTEDIVQETYIKAHQGIEGFKGDASLKTWIFTIAINLAKNHLHKKNRWLENAQDYGAMLHVKSKDHWDKFHEVFYTSPDRNYEIREHISYCFNCITKTLLIEQQVCLLLKEVYEFKVDEIMKITGLTEGKVKHALADARANMIRIFENRCAFVNKNGVCHQCTQLKGILNPEQDAHIKANEIKLVKKGLGGNHEYLLDLRIQLTKDIDPLSASNTVIHTYMLESCERWVEEGMEKKVLDFPSESNEEDVKV
ncbi:MAG TPA: RNA polymerase sigma factor [Cytophagales bacterium]|nr:RNA polymerase sigma factor [Cytophagales bacterium]